MSFTRFFRRTRWDDERARELESYLAIETDENIARGMAPDAARAAARRRLGNATRIREEIYDMNTLSVVETVRLDCRDALRQLRRRPMGTVVALVLLAIGIGASAAAYSVAYGLFVRPLPYPDAARLAVLWQETGGRLAQVSFPDFEDIRAAVPFDTAAIMMSGRATLSGGVEADRVAIVESGPELLTLLGAKSVLGRLTTAADANRHVAVISSRLWRSVLQGDPAVLGRPIRVSGTPYTVVGVLAPLEFELPVPGGDVGSGFVIRDVDMWMPFNVAADMQSSRAVSTFEAIVRLQADWPLESTRSALDIAASNLARAHPETNRGRRFTLTPLREHVVQSSLAAVRIALAGALLILVIACANLATLFLSDLPARRRDFALRAALGATRGRLFRQLALEGALLGIAGGSAGLFLGHALIATVKDATELTRQEAIGFDWPVTLAIVAAAVTAGLSSRLLPALVQLRARPHDLRSSMSAYATTAPLLRRGLVLVQLAFAIVLSVSAALLAISLQRAATVDPGFSSDHALAARVSAYAARYPDKAATARFVDALVGRVAGQPGVTAAAAAQSLPLTDDSVGTSVAVEGRVVPMAERPVVGWQTVTPDYFRTLRIPVLAGRSFVPADRTRRSHQTVISRTLARHLFGEENPIGRRLSFGPDDPVADWHEIVGVVGDVRQASLTAPAGPRVYDLFGQHWSRTVYVIARGDLDPSALAASLRSAVHQTDAEVPVFEMQTLDAIVSGTLAPRRWSTAFAIALAGVSVLLAATGLYGLLAAAVASRTRELGIRRALGSTAWQVARLVISEAAAVAGLGAVAGAAGAIGAERLIRSQLFGVQASDAASVGAVAVALLIVAAAAAYTPARRAIRVDPVIALREE